MTLQELINKMRRVDRDPALLLLDLNKILDSAETMSHALAFYADKENWYEKLNERGFRQTSAIIKDSGAFARQAQETIDKMCEGI